MVKAAFLNKVLHMILQVFAFVLSLVLKQLCRSNRARNIQQIYFRDNEIICVLTAMVVGHFSSQTKSIQTDNFCTRSKRLTKKCSASNLSSSAPAFKSYRTGKLISSKDSNRIQNECQSAWHYRKHDLTS